VTNTCVWPVRKSNSSVTNTCVWPVRKSNSSVTNTCVWRPYTCIGHTTI
jgi:hypothetical protein